MAKAILYLFIVISFISPSLTHSEENKKVNYILDSISGDYAECAAYYTIVYHSMVSANEAAAANNYAQLQETAINYALQLASEGRSIEMTGKVTKSRIEMYNKKMKQEAGNDAANISVLINKYHFKCTNALENPEKYIQEVKEELEKKQKNKK